MGEATPKSIGQFRILSKIGQGGMGGVYQAVHGTLERTVALKILPPEFSAHPEYVTRFLREARVIATLRHENIINIHDSGEIGGQYYIAMDFIDGGNLLNVADARVKIDEKEGLRLMLQAARGLSAAHDKGLIHRDIKPENLLLGTDGILRLVDFGLVADTDSTTHLTQAGTCLGTPMYMSPEQADGEHTDVRSDLYSLGASFFRIFTGRPPFIGATVMNTLFKQKFEKPPDPRSIRADLSRGTSDLLLHLLAKPREDRPPNARALMAMIEELLAGKSIPEPLPFRPLEPKPRAEEPVASVAPDGETAVLFGGSDIRPKPEAPASGGSTLAAALIVFAIAAAVLFFIASNSRRDNAAQVRNPPPAEQPKPPEKPALTESEMLDRVKLGDAAFREGRIKDAREIYLDILKVVPNHVELIARCDRADRRIKFDLDMTAAEKLEKEGKLEDALVRYGEAQALDEENAAAERIERVKAALAQSKKPVAQFSAAPEQVAAEKAAAERARELDSAAKSAQDFLLLQNYERAEAAFLRAAELATDARNATFKEKAVQCRRLNYLAQAHQSETNNDFAAAEAAYLKALEIASDEPTLAQLTALRQKMKPPEDKNLALYKEAMREGQEAMDKGDYKVARVKFGVAMGLKPELSPPGSKLNEIEARETIFRADEARERGEIETARKLYLEAQAKHPPLEPDIQARINELAKAPTRPARAIEKACALARERKDEEALKVIDEALVIDPKSAELLEAKAALDAARRAEDIFEGLKNVETLALQRFKEAAEIENDDTTKKMNTAMANNLKQLGEMAKLPLGDFGGKDFKGAMGQLTVAHNHVTDLSVELGKASDYYTKLSDKADDKVGLKIPGLPKFGIGGDRKKSEKYKALIESIKQLINQCKDLQK